VANDQNMGAYGKKNVTMCLLSKRPIPITLGGFVGSVLSVDSYHIDGDFQLNAVDNLWHGSSYITPLSSYPLTETRLKRKNA
jgi:hypothetical protein